VADKAMAVAAAGELQPDTREVLQEEPYVMPVQGAVSVQGPVRVQALPRKGGATRTRLVPAARAVQVLAADHRRARVTLMSLDKEMLVGFSEAATQDESSMSAWPVNVPFVCDATVDVYLQSGDDTDSTRVSITTELWSEG
jgi:hypothetical protein